MPIDCSAEQPDIDSEANMQIGTADWFVLIRVQVTEGRAVMIYEDGNDIEHARQEIPYTDFPLSSITLYACWDQENWVIMLPSEY